MPGAWAVVNGHVSRRVTSYMVNDSGTSLLRRVQKSIMVNNRVSDREPYSTAV